MTIIQLLSHSGDLYCLDFDGNVHIWNPNINDWTLFYEEKDTI